MGFPGKEHTYGLAKNQMLSPETIHTSSIVQTELAVFMYLSVFSQARAGV